MTRYLMQTMDVYLEIGKKKVFAGAVEWPGWCRSAPNEELALQALCDYGQRYASALHPVQLEFQPPPDPSAFTVIERLAGDASTDFGAPGKIPGADNRPVGEAELHRLQALLAACWQALDDAARAAEGRELRQGPRGGGRDLEKMLRHVLDAEAAYLARIGCKLPPVEGSDLSVTWTLIRNANMDALASAARGDAPAKGPRGGIRWPPRYYARRSAWHVLDHAWEIEDRIMD